MHKGKVMNRYKHKLYDKVYMFKHIKNDVIIKIINNTIKFIITNNFYLKLLKLNRINK